MLKHEIQKIIQNRIENLQDRIEQFLFSFYHAILFYTALDSVFYYILLCILFYSILQTLF